MPDETYPYLSVLDFWFSAGPKKWYANGDKFDKAIADKFGVLHESAAKGGCDDWAAHPAGALALILLLDQFSRNLFRNDARAFAQDAKGLKVAEDAIAKGFDKAYVQPALQFFYVPFMHSENMAHQERGIDLFRRAGEDCKDNLHYALLHMDVIRRFGRFPHRNKALGRETTEAEAGYLASAGGF